MAFDFTRAPLRGRLRSCGVLLLAVAAALGPACASAPRRPPPGTLEPDKFLFERGTEELNDKDWFTAREYFRQLVDSYPQSPYRGDAKLGVVTRSEKGCVVVAHDNVEAVPAAKVERVVDDRHADGGRVILGGGGLQRLAVRGDRPG